MHIDAKELHQLLGRLQSFALTDDSGDDKQLLVNAGSKNAKLGRSESLRVSLSVEGY